jgi:hypothetical protein
MHSSYLVRADAKVQTSADADRAGMRVGAVKGQSQQIYLSGNLKNAKVSAPNSRAWTWLHNVSRFSGLLTTIV